MKLFLSFTEGTDASAHMSVKVTIPKKWEVGPVSKLLHFAVDTYNGKRLSPRRLEVDSSHLVKAGGVALGSEELVCDVVGPGDRVELASGAAGPGGAQELVRAALRRGRAAGLGAAAALAAARRRRGGGRRADGEPLLHAAARAGRVAALAPKAARVAAGGGRAGRLRGDGRGRAGVGAPRRVLAGDGSGALRLLGGRVEGRGG